MKDAHLFKWFFLINFAVNCGFGLADSFFSSYLFGLGGRSLLLGLPLLSFSLAKTLLSPVMGTLVDRMGERRAVTVSLVVFLLVSCGYLAGSNLWFLTLLRLLQGAACALFRPVMLALVGGVSTASRRGQTVGTFDISFYGALAVGPIVGGLLHDRWGFHGVFSGLLSLCLVALGIALLTVPKRPHRGRTIPGRVPTALVAGRHLLRGATMRALVFFIFGRACGTSLLVAFLPILLTSRLGLTGGETGVVLASTTLVTTCLLRPAGALSDLVSRKGLLIMGGSIVSLLYLLIPTVDGFFPILAVSSCIGLGNVLSQPASTALLLEQGGRHHAGFTIGVFNAALNLGFATGPLLGAWLESRFGLTAVFQAAGGIGLITMVLCAASLLAKESGARGAQNTEAVPCS